MTANGRPEFRAGRFAAVGQMVGLGGEIGAR
jgi:hypothetical protein